MVLSFPKSCLAVAKPVSVPSASAPNYYSQDDDARGGGVQVKTNAYKQVTVSQKKIKVAINGFGRIGRAFVRCQHARENSNLEIVVINDSGGVKQASHLLKYDSTYGTFNADVKVRFRHRSTTCDGSACIGHLRICMAFCSFVFAPASP